MPRPPQPRRDFLWKLAGAATAATIRLPAQAATTEPTGRFEPHALPGPVVRPAGS